MGNCIQKKKETDSARTSGVLTPIKKIKIRRSNFRKIYTVLDKIYEKYRTSIFLVSDKLTEEKRAVKSIKLNDRDYHSVLHELEILQRLDHPNILKVFDCFLEANYLHIITEYCSGDELFERITSKICFTEHLAAIYMRQITSALIYLQKNRIIHRDLKPSNILFVDMEDDSLLKIVNFSKINESSSYLFKSPECFSGKPVPNSNIWNLGVIFYLMLSGSLPFPENHSAEEHFIHIQNLEVKFEGKIWKSVSQEAKNLVQKMLVRDPNQRIAASEIFESDWMKTFINNKAAPRLSRRSLTKLSTYSKKSKLKRAMLTYMVSKVNLTGDVKRLMKVFRDADAEGQGELSPDQIISCIKRASVTVEEPLKLVRSMNINRKGFVTYSEFLTSLIDWNQELSENKLKKVFQEFDLNGDGVITNEEFLEVLQSNYSLEEMQMMMKEADLNGDGLIDYGEFVNFFTNDI